MKHTLKLAAILGVFLGSFGLTYAATVIPYYIGGTGDYASGFIPFGTGAHTYAATSSSLFWDNTNSRLGIATGTPFGSLSANAAAGVWPLVIGSSTQTNFAITPFAGITLTEKRPATTTSMQLDWAATGPQVLYQIGTSATTINVINATTTQYAGSRKLVVVCNPAASAGALTFGSVEWAGGTVPTQTTTTNQCDVYSFFITNATSTTAYKVFGAMSAGFQ